MGLVALFRGGSENLENAKKPTQNSISLFVYNFVFILSGIYYVTRFGFNVLDDKNQ